MEFQSTHPRGVRLVISLACSIGQRFQSTHPRGVRRRKFGGKRIVFGISIHAPTWGATHSQPPRPLDLKFQSTHPRGVRLIVGGVPYSIEDFNPRTHVGCDTRSPTRTPSCWNFNPRTHVGCDRSRFCHHLWPCYFNPRTHVGCDAIMTRQKIEDRRFQSTHPRGVRLYVSTLRLCTGNFNPRTHVGCDWIVD